MWGNYKKLKRVKQKLTRENKSALMRMGLYMYGHGINQIVLSRIEYDLACKLYEGQTDGLTTEAIVNGNYETFCDEVIKDALHKSIMQYILEGIVYFGWILIFIVPFFSVMEGALGYTRMEPWYIVRFSSEEFIRNLTLSIFSSCNVLVLNRFIGKGFWKAVGRGILFGGGIGVIFNIAMSELVKGEITFNLITLEVVLLCSCILASTVKYNLAKRQDGRHTD